VNFILPVTSIPMMYIHEHTYAHSQKIFEKQKTKERLSCYILL